MALNAVVTDIESVPEEVRSFYKPSEDGTKHILDVQGAEGYELENTSALRSALGKERQSVADLSKRLKTYDGLDPDAARTALSKVEEIASFDPEQKVQEALEQRQKQLLQKHAQEIENVQKERDVLLSELEQNLITSAATKAIANSKGSVDLLLPHVKNQTRMRRLETGQYIAEVVDSAGTPRIGDAQGNPMTIPQLIEEMKTSEAFMRAFEPSGATGTGATGTTSSAPAVAAPTGSVKKISKTDSEAINANIEGLANGTVILVD